MYIFFTQWLSGSRIHLQCRRCRRRGFDPWVGKILWRKSWQPTPVFLPGESHGQRSLVGYSPQGCKELDTIEATVHCRVAAGAGGSHLLVTDKRLLPWPGVSLSPQGTSTFPPNFPCALFCSSGLNSGPHDIMSRGSVLSLQKINEPRGYLVLIIIR